MTAERTRRGTRWWATAALATAVLTAAAECGGTQSATRTTPAGITVAPSYQLLSRDLDLPGPAGVIPATVTRPDAPGRFPALLLLADGVAVDRDWNQPGIPGRNGSGRLLAEQLSRRGVVVARFDQPGSGGRALPERMTWQDLLADDQAVIDWLAADPGVDPDHLFVAGHGEGGLSAMRLAAGNDAVAGVILLASPGRPLAELLLSRLEQDFRLIAGLHGEALEAEMAPLRDGLARFVTGGAIDPAAVTRQVNIQQLLQPLADPRVAEALRERYRFDPVEAIARVSVPILILGGGKDIDTSAALDLEALREPATLGSGDVTVHISPDADHALQVEEMPRSELDRGEVRGEVRFRYNAADRKLDADVVATLAGWLAKHARPAAPSAPKPGPAATERAGSQ